MRIHSKSKFIKDAIREQFGSFADHRSNSPAIIPAQNPRTRSLYAQSNLAAVSSDVVGTSCGCGNPIALANLKSGEQVLDLGSGGGLDCFIAAKAVGPAGYVIGLDMTDQMLALANENKSKVGSKNVEFRKGEIEDMPVESNTIDVVTSNGVIVLSPDKDAVFRETYRVLKPGGRFVMSDHVTEGDVPKQLRINVNMYMSRINAPIDETEFGAIDKVEFLEKLHRVGFTNIAVWSRSFFDLEDLDALDRQSREALGRGVDWSVVPLDCRYCNVDVVAYKPSSS